MVPPQLSLWQKLQSRFYPVSLYKSSSIVNPVLELFYYNGRHILATQDAVYSDGHKYRPLMKAFNSKYLKPQLHRLRKILVLGTGLASAVHILYAKGLNPHYTLVEIDEQVLEWAMRYLPGNAASTVRPVRDDAFPFLASDQERYDLIIVDIFLGREVPEAVMRASFLEQCKTHLQADGFLVLNYMVNNSAQESQAKAGLQSVFRSVDEISFGINKVYITGA